MSDLKQQKTFLEAYEAHNDAIFRFCIIKLRNHDSALDITQDTFVKTWEYLAEGKQVKNIRAFLYQVARNLIIDHIRKKKSYSLDHIVESGIDFGFDAADRWEDHIDGEKVLQELGTLLKKKDHDTLIMRFVEDMTITEIAEILDEKENTISVRIHRALKKLEEILQNSPKKNEQ